jgi:thiaminase/transcriptional activator TenA
MKNPRSIHLEDNFIAQHQLSTSPPPPNSLFWKMWNASENIAQQALNTGFIQGIKTGTLNPVTYGAFNISDAYYCFHGAADYLTAANKATHPVLEAFLLKKHKSYQQYNDTFPKTWRIKDASGIVPTEVCQQYSQFESGTASHEHPIYMLVVMLPCEYLWAWLAGQLSPPTQGNLYASWITGNDDPKGAYAMGNFLNDYAKENPLDEDLALKLYTQAMTYEFRNFKTAVGS